MVFDLSNRYASLDAKKDPLDEIDAVVPWEEFRPALERFWRRPDEARKSRVGHKPMAAWTLTRLKLKQIKIRTRVMSQTRTIILQLAEAEVTGRMDRAFLALFCRLLTTLSCTSRSMLNESCKTGQSTALKNVAAGPT